jgi:hypothetical protein
VSRKIWQPCLALFHSSRLANRRLLAESYHECLRQDLRPVGTETLFSK